MSVERMSQTMERGAVAVRASHQISFPSPPPPAKDGSRFHISSAPKNPAKMTSISWRFRRQVVPCDPYVKHIPDQALNVAS